MNSMILRILENMILCIVKSRTLDIIKDWVLGTVKRNVYEIFRWIWEGNVGYSIHWLNYCFTYWLLLYKQWSSQNNINTCHLFWEVLQIVVPHEDEQLSPEQIVGISLRSLNKTCIDPQRSKNYVIGCLLKIEIEFIIYIDTVHIMFRKWWCRISFTNYLSFQWEETRRNSVDNHHSFHCGMIQGMFRFPITC